DNGPFARLSSADIHDQFARALEQPGAQASQAGDVAAAVATASRVVEAEYAVPYLAHATMEPMNFTASVTAESCEMWGPTQAPTAAVMVAQQMTELPPEKISVHPSLLGGGFGRRFEADFMVDAVALSKAVGKPVKVVWSREEDTRHDFYRPATLNRLRAGLDENGQLLSWEHAIAGSSILSRSFPQFVKDGIDFSSVEGAANLPYGVANLDVNYHQVEPGVPVGFWRSVGSSQNAFVTEGFVDELAVAAGADPYEYRRNLLADHPRHRQVLERAAKHAGWGKPRPTGRFQGIAVHESFGSYVAQVVEISMADDGSIRVHRVVCVVDCGVVVNPDTVRAQMESGIVFGLSAALTGAITIEDGRVQQSNFHDYSVLRMNQMPEIEVHIVASDEAPGGVGEPGTPPIAPALVNAVYQATGKRLRQLPVDQALRQA
ncbi:MAG: molybdopterin-dependent oxidoreductase, partial [Gammaproteobacteria bacterium]|nr:molybdopterin-dependent oxidoreductase [Gammaproteobacteria bacterium]